MQKPLNHKITFILDTDLQTKGKTIQSELLSEHSEINWNFSDIINGVMEAGFTKLSKSDIKSVIIKHKKERKY